MSRSKRTTYAIEKIPKNEGGMISRTSFRCHTRVPRILDVSFLRARIPFQRLTCDSFCYERGVQHLPRRFFKNSRAFMCSLRISCRDLHSGAV